MLAWGIGLGVLTPAVVAAAVAAVDSDRAGLASGITTPPAKPAGRSASPPTAPSPASATKPGHFLAGIRTTGLITAGLFLTAAIATVALIHCDRQSP